ncbi:FAD-dependent oxidoreductase [Nitratifractor sp.]|uniref:FAD-dependent oxidoreductase n=1 Tax=Nitratifractor sp. TaxID=2268144 RepID=UPI0025FECB01|nr:FAD-dependent oxidoreductase [Nitratifractor sp.]
MFDLLIIGSGGAGLSAALEAATAGARVAVACKSMPTQAQTCMAQGGINAALGNVEPDSIEEHIADTLRSAHGLADETMVRTLCEAGPQTIEWLDRMLVPFSRIQPNKNSTHSPLPTTHSLQTIAQRRLGGASHPRACFAQDFTGLKILQSLYDRCLEAGVTFYPEHTLIDLISADGRVFGAHFWHFAEGKIHTLQAQATLLATGGFGDLYHGHSTNAYGASGDGVAAALRAGAALSDMEYVQFHPTAMAGSALLISEGARGAGAILIDEKGERFTDELGPRDQVARAIFQKIDAGEKVFLDLRPIPRKTLEELMPQELHLARLHAHIDPLEEPIPIQPAVHYSMGGIDVDRRLAARGLEGLWAAGECSNAHVHGANRLGGNSLLEIVAFGRLAARNALANLPTPPTAGKIPDPESRIEAIFARNGKFNPYHKRKILGKRLYHDLGIIREEPGMRSVLEYVAELKEKLSQTALQDRARRFNRALIEYLEYESSLLLADAATRAALLRRESRGAHWRSDYPEESKEWEKHIQVKMNDGEVKTC